MGFAPATSRLRKGKCISFVMEAGAVALAFRFFQLFFCKRLEVTVGYHRPFLHGAFGCEAAAFGRIAENLLCLLRAESHHNGGHVNVGCVNL